MDDASPAKGSDHGGSDHGGSPLVDDDAAIDGPTSAPDDQQLEADFDESLFEEASALIDDTRTYVEAELGFQKTRAKLAGYLIGTSLVLVIVALILLHIAFLALAVGLVMALEPVVTIWGAIGIVFGGLLLLVILLCWMAYKRASKLGAIFSPPESGDDA